MLLTVWTFYISNVQNRMKKVFRIWPGNTTITHCRPTHCTARKRHSTNSPNDIQSKFLSNHLSLPQRDDCKTRNDTKYCTTKQEPNKQIQKKQTIAATTISNQQQHTHRLIALSRSYWGLKLIVMAKSSPYIMLLSKPKKR